MHGLAGSHVAAQTGGERLEEGRNGSHQAEEAGSKVTEGVRSK
jgi:hypothetical protein